MSGLYSLATDRVTSFDDHILMLNFDATGATVLRKTVLAAVGNECVRNPFTAEEKTASKTNREMPGGESPTTTDFGSNTSQVEDYSSSGGVAPMRKRTRKYQNLENPLASTCRQINTSKSASTATGNKRSAARNARTPLGNANSAHNRALGISQHKSQERGQTQAEKGLRSPPEPDPINGTLLEDDESFAAGDIFSSTNQQHHLSEPRRNVCGTKDDETTMTEF